MTWLWRLIFAPVKADIEDLFMLFSLLPKEESSERHNKRKGYYEQM